MKNLIEIEAALRGPNPDHVAISEALGRISDECYLIKLEATLTLRDQFARDLRPAVRVYLTDLARVHGRTTAEQVRACMLDGDPWFKDLALAAWAVLL